MVGQIDTGREAALLQISFSLQDLKYSLLRGTEGCSFECRSLLLGALIKYMHDDGLLEDTLKTPYGGHSLVDAIKRVQAMKSPDHDWHRDPVDDYLGACPFSLSNLTQPLIDRVKEDIKGLCVYDW